MQDNLLYVPYDESAVLRVKSKYNNVFIMSIRYNRNGYEFDMPYAISIFQSEYHVESILVPFFTRPCDMVPNIEDKLNPFRLTGETRSINIKEFTYSNQYGKPVFNLIEKLKFLHKEQEYCIGFIRANDKTKNEIDKTHIITVSSEKYDLDDIKIYEHFDEEYTSLAYEYFKSISVDDLHFSKYISNKNFE